MSAGTVVLVDDEEDVRRAISQKLELEDFKVECFARADRVLEHIGPSFAGVLVSDIKMPQKDGLTLLQEVQEIDPDLPVILITGHGDVPLAVKAMQAGAYDFLEKPFQPSRLLDAVTRATEKRLLTLENRDLRSRLEQRDTLESMLVGRSRTMLELRQRLRTIAATDADVLILGETGTGKDLAARAIHQLSDRQDKPFVAVNMAALPADTIESELFGHESGAFAHAHRARVGKFEHARGGTLFLDEIGAIPTALQAKLLRAIEDRVIERLGSNERIALDVRFLASSKEDLAAEVREGRFRDDLYYRLNVVTVSLPPMSQRMDDAPRLFHHLVNQAALRYRRETPELTADVLAQVAARDWPGNVRELRNAADRYVLGLGLDEDATAPVSGSLASQVDRFEKNAIAAALMANRGNLKATYEALELSRKTLYEKIHKHGLRREDFTEA